MKLTLNIVFMDETIKICIQEINPHVVCSLCGGYFIDATTITECLHTFCKSCIVKYLMSCKHCPQCQLKVHETHPLFLLRPDRTLQDIVYKLIPNLFENEELRREEFNKSRGMAIDKKPGTKKEEPTVPKLSSIINNPDGHLYKNDEQICLCLERYRPQRIMHHGKVLTLRALDRKFLRCSIRVLVSHLKAMLYKKLAIPSDVQIEVICDREVLSDEVSMKQIFLMNWFGKETPMVLYYRFRETSDNSVTKVPPVIILIVKMMAGEEPFHVQEVKVTWCLDRLTLQVAPLYEEGIQKLVAHYDKCLNYGGDYVEK